MPGLAWSQAVEFTSSAMHDARFIIRCRMNVEDEAQASLTGRGITIKN